MDGTTHAFLAYRHIARDCPNATSIRTLEWSQADVDEVMQDEAARADLRALEEKEEEPVPPAAEAAPGFPVSRE